MSSLSSWFPPRDQSVELIDDRSPTGCFGQRTFKKQGTMKEVKA
jgi:hypothetical protein